MGYDLHLTRAADWTLSEQDPITLDEWLAVAESGGHVEADDRVSGLTVPPFRLLAEPDGPGLYWHESGRIVVRGTDDSSVPHLVALAERLGAHVVGDDGEHYRADGTTFEVDLSDDEPEAGPDPEPPAGRRRWFGRR